MEIDKFPFRQAGDRTLTCRLRDGRTVRGSLYAYDATSRCLALIKPASPTTALDDYILINTNSIATIDYVAQAEPTTTQALPSSSSSSRPPADQTIKVAVPRSPAAALTQSPVKAEGGGRPQTPLLPTAKHVVVQGQENYSPGDRSTKITSTSLAPPLAAANRNVSSPSRREHGQSHDKNVSTEMRILHDALSRHLPVKYSADGQCLHLGDDLSLVAPYTSADIRSAMRQNLSQEEKAKREAALARAKRLIDTERAVLFPGARTTGSTSGGSGGGQTGRNKPATPNAWKRRKEPPARGG